MLSGCFSPLRQGRLLVSFCLCYLLTAKKDIMTLLLTTRVVNIDILPEALWLCQNALFSSEECKQLTITSIDGWKAQSFGLGD